MRFKFHALSDTDFEKWVAGVKAANATLSRDIFIELDKPSVREPVHHYSAVASDLYERILNRCVDGTRMCANQVMAIDAGGVGSAANYRVAQLDRRKYVEALACTPANPDGALLPLAPTTSQTDSPKP
jgi:cytochrome o ubiquinol oxidase subunit 2